jgi:hypothetical protein
MVRGNKTPGILYASAGWKGDWLSHRVGLNVMPKRIVYALPET